MCALVLHDWWVIFCMLEPDFKKEGDDAMCKNLVQWKMAKVWQGNKTNWGRSEDPNTSVCLLESHSWNSVTFTLFLNNCKLACLLLNNCNSSWRSWKSAILDGCSTEGYKWTGWIGYLRVGWVIEYHRLGTNNYKCWDPDGNAVRSSWASLAARFLRHRIEKGRTGERSS